MLEKPLFCKNPNVFKSRGISPLHHKRNRREKLMRREERRGEKN